MYYMQRVILSAFLPVYYDVVAITKPATSPEAAISTPPPISTFNRYDHYTSAAHSKDECRINISPNVSHRIHGANSCPPQKGYSGSKKPTTGLSPQKGDSPFSYGRNISPFRDISKYL